MTTRALWCWVCGAVLCAAPVAQGKVFMNMKEALDLAFPKCEVERKSVYLEKDQRERVGVLAGDEFEKGLVFPYVATANGKVVGTAYFDRHRVRTKNEILMVVISPKSEIERIEVLAFAEPLDYVPRDTWYAQFPGRKLDSDLRLKVGIKGVTGATMTARATTKAARRLLALHNVIAELEKKAPAPKPKPKQSSVTRDDGAEKSKSKPSESGASKTAESTAAKKGAPAKRVSRRTRGTP